MSPAVAATAIPPPTARGRGTRRILRHLARGPLAVAALLAIALLLVAALFGPVLAPYPEDAEGAIHADARLQPPSATHRFGTDELGRDVFSRVLIGARISLSLGVIVLVIGVTIGTILGAVAGFVGGRVGEVIMRWNATFPGLAIFVTVFSFNVLGDGLRDVLDPRTTD